ncbi:MAG TPA: DapH/DapD/GlmU-related protein, partial [Longimicrobiales bacterium]|nr:DapH/DapD/GlmU-related protein [Longimicrobiales bacterium]
MSDRITWWRLFRRLRWDLQDRYERQYYGYWLISQVPGLFGSMLRARYLGRRMKRAGSNLRVLAGCRFRSLENLEVGDNVSIGYDNFLQARGGLTIGNNVGLAPGVKIWSTNHDYDDPDAPVLEQTHTHKPVSIGDNVFIASNAFILPGTILPEGCIVSAGAVVGGKPYRPFSILAGNPARVIGYRGGR